MAVLQVNFQDFRVAGFESNVLLAVLSALAYDLVLGEPDAMTRMILASLLSECRFLDGLLSLDFSSIRHVCFESLKVVAERVRSGERERENRLVSV